MITGELRELVRRAYGYHCGYCGVHEDEVGNELEIDHFQPVSQGGSDEVANLVYCCTACNRNKGDFWPTAAQRAAQRYLLHPALDDYAAHFREEPNGQLTALTLVGQFHLSRLRLNRAQLAALRRNRQENLGLCQKLGELQAEQTKLREALARRDDEIKGILAQLRRLLE